MKKPRPKAERAKARPSTREPAGAERATRTGIVSFHPQRGGALTLAPVPPGHGKYKGGKDSDWREIARVDVHVYSGDRPEPVPGQALPTGYLWGDPSMQVSGMGMFHQVYGPLDRRCVACGTHFVWPASAQKDLYEVERAHVNTIANHCRACARARRVLEQARVTYAAAIAVAKDATTAEPSLALARATLAVLDAGGRANLERAIGAIRRARRLGAGAAADALDAKLRARRGR